MESTITRERFAAIYDATIAELKEKADSKVLPKFIQIAHDEQIFGNQIALTLLSVVTKKNDPFTALDALTSVAFETGYLFAKKEQETSDVDNALQGIANASGMVN